MAHKQRRGRHNTQLLIRNIEHPLQRHLTYLLSALCPLQFAQGLLHSHLCKEPLSLVGHPYSLELHRMIIVCQQPLITLATDIYRLLGKH